MARSGTTKAAIAGVIAVGIVLTAVAAATSVTAAPVNTVGDTQIDPDIVLLHVSVQEDGTGVWRIEYRIRLDDDNTTEAFEAVSEDVASNSSQFKEPFATDMRRTIESAENTTGREMALKNVEVDAERKRLPQRFGVITYRFEWVGFAAVTESGFRVGDALAGAFLDRETSLFVTWPDSYRSTKITPEPDEQRDGAAIWNGPVQFANNEPRVVLSSAPPPTTVPETPTKTPTTATETATPSGQNQNSPSDEQPSETDDGGEPGTENPPRLGVLPIVAVVVIALFGTGAGVMILRGDWGRNSGTGASDGSSAELLTNEERVITLLEERDGRIKQQQIVEEFGWTESKTSKVVRELRDADRIDVFRLGRENVLTLPDNNDI